METIWIVLLLFVTIGYVLFLGQSVRDAHEKLARAIDAILIVSKVADSQSATIKSHTEALQSMASELEDVAEAVDEYVEKSKEGSN